MGSPVNLLVVIGDALTAHRVLQDNRIGATGRIAVQHVTPVNILMEQVLVHVITVRLGNMLPRVLGLVRRSARVITLPVREV
jgi:hypothetical protein